MYRSIHPLICLPVCLSIDRSNYLSIHPSIQLSIFLSIYLPISKTSCLSVYLSIDLSMYVGTCLYLSICKFTQHVFTHKHARNLYIQLVCLLAYVAPSSEIRRRMLRPIRSSSKLMSRNHDPSNTEGSGFYALILGPARLGVLAYRIQVLWYSSETWTCRYGSHPRLRRGHSSKSTRLRQHWVQRLPQPCRTEPQNGA